MMLCKTFSIRYLVHSAVIQSEVLKIKQSYKNER